MALYFGPLSADDPTLNGLSKVQALNVIRDRIRPLVKELAPPKPNPQPPHEPLCQESGPWLWLGTGDRMHAAQWYQTCQTCNPVILHFITDPLDANLVTGKSALGKLFDVYQEVKDHPDDYEDDVSEAPTDTEDKDSSDGGGGSAGSSRDHEDDEGSVNDDEGVVDDDEEDLSSGERRRQLAPFPPISPLYGPWFD